MTPATNQTNASPSYVRVRDVFRREVKNPGAGMGYLTQSAVFGPADSARRQKMWPCFPLKTAGRLLGLREVSQHDFLSGRDISLP